MGIQVLVADDHLIVRQGLKELLEREGFAVVGEASDGGEAVQLARSLRPDVAVLDLAMPNMNGLEAAREMPNASPRTKTILLTMHADDVYVLQALRSGIRGYVLKSQAAADLAQAIHEVARGATYLSPRICQTVVQASLGRTEFPGESLTARERHILQLIAEGNTTKQVATVLGISVKTAESHRTRMMEKLNIHETASLVRYAIRLGIAQP